MMMDQKTLLLKSRIPLADVAGFTVSPYSDGIVVILLKKVQYKTRSGDHAFLFTAILPASDLQSKNPITRD